MTWSAFPTVFAISTGFWAASVASVYICRMRPRMEILAHLFFWAGMIAMTMFILGLWGSLERPPFRTLGETRLWYGFFMPLIGYLTWRRWQLNWVLAYSILMAVVFLGINVMSPDVHDRALMPALQSPWFVPHVIVYIFAYALLAVSAIVAVKALYEGHRGRLSPSTLTLADNLVYIGFSFLTLGLIFGAIWGKEAWGHYWNWDPKEVWALLTWIVYLAYIHIRAHRPGLVQPAMWTLALAFVVLLVCWFGVNYLPSAQDSIHTY